MKRDLSTLAAESFDVLIIGGGAFGAAAAWDATIRGLKVALIEQSDFGSGASAECFKMVHGGIRYLQHADVRRLRYSCAQRSALLRIAPHLVTPLPIVIPTYGHGRQGKAFLAAGMLAYDTLTIGRNAGIRDPSRQIRGMELLSKTKVLELFPELEPRALTGGAVFEDGQMYNAARLVLAFVKSAVARGAIAANYTQALSFLWQGKRVCGVRARDCAAGSKADHQPDWPGRIVALGARGRVRRGQRAHQSQRRNDRPAREMANTHRGFLPKSSVIVSIPVRACAPATAPRGIRTPRRDTAKK